VQAALLPSHWSTVQGLPSLPHAVAAGLRASAGQFGPLPGQSSAGSHSPVEARHSSVLGRKPSAGQLVLVPVQVSAASQTPAAARQTAPVFPAGCSQAALEPSHSSRVQRLPSLVHAVPFGVLVSAGHVVLEPVQVS
jgi:hypothetical protein